MEGEDEVGKQGGHLHMYSRGVRMVTYFKGFFFFPFL